MNTKGIIAIKTCALIFCIDQFTKAIAQMHCMQAPIFINDVLSFHVAYNRGISWNLLHFESPWLFFMVSLLIFGVIIMIASIAYQAFVKNQMIGGYVLIIAGACSNLLDRLLYHGVVDFIEVSYKTYQWPTFNCADISIVCGALFILYHELIMTRHYV